MSLFGMNALSFGEMIWSRVHFNLLAIVSPIILYITLHELIGQYSNILVRLLTFGIREIWVWFSSAISPGSLRTCRHVVVTSSLTDCQCFWKKTAGKPSGPGAFDGFICASVVLTSSFVNGSASSAFISSDIFFVTLCKAHSH